MWRARSLPYAGTGDLPLRARLADRLFGVDLLLLILRWLTVLVGLLMAGGTAISMSRSPHWFIRGWDFPRVQITTLAAGSAGAYAVFFMNGAAWEWAFLAVCLATAAWQVYRIAPYLPFAPTTVAEADRPSEDTSLHLVASNVLQENDQFERWEEVVRTADPDVLLALEVDDRWDQFIAEALGEDYPHAVRYPQDNHYGMVLYSRLPLVDPNLRFIIEDDAPSIHTGVELPGGKRIYLHGVHPRPPEPLRNEDATARDAEVVVVGREIDAEERPTVIAGDFNDVAWSHTSELFLRVSQLLDPRKGRGFFNTFDARYPLVSWPLDHVFHSNDFKLTRLRLLPFVGSDHFPVSITLSYEPDAPAEQPEPAQRPEDVSEAQEKVERAAEENGAEVLENEGADPERETPAHPDLNAVASGAGNAAAEEAATPPQDGTAAARNP
ncbi:MAG: endonuclease [Bacteroidetes bacterium QS_9_68_14]|nr:MAG: endonuclease [Bacteroidetes bacterium QS_9_68_14]